MFINRKTEDAELFHLSFFGSSAIFCIYCALTVHIIAVLFEILGIELAHTIFTINKEVAEISFVSKCLLKTLTAYLFQSILRF